MKRAKGSPLLMLLKILIIFIIILIIVWFIFFAGTTIGNIIGGTIEKHVEYNPTIVKKVESIGSKLGKAFDPLIKAWECINDPEKCYSEPWENIQSIEHKEQVEKKYGIEILPPLETPVGVFTCNKKRVLKIVEENGKKKKVFENAVCSGSPVPIYFNIKANLPLGEKANLRFNCYVDYEYLCDILKVNSVSPKQAEAYGSYETQVVCTLKFNNSFYKNEDCLYQGKIKKYYEVPVTFRVTYEATSKTDFWVLIVKPEAYSEDFFERYHLDRMKYTVSKWIGVPSVIVALGSPSGREAVYMFSPGLSIYLAAVLRKSEDVKVVSVEWKICVPKVFEYKDIMLPPTFIDKEKIEKISSGDYLCLVFPKDALKTPGLIYLNEHGSLPVLIEFTYNEYPKEDYAEYYIYSTVNFTVRKEYKVYVKYSGVLPE